MTTYNTTALINELTDARLLTIDLVGRYLSGERESVFDTIFDIGEGGDLPMIAYLLVDMACEAVRATYGQDAERKLTKLRTHIRGEAP